MGSELNSGHGHVVPRPDGMKARCGGPALCPVCRKEAKEAGIDVTEFERPKEQKEPPREKTLSLATLHSLLIRLSNQAPVRYYLDGRGNGTFSHFRLEVWLPRTEGFPEALNNELVSLGLYPDVKERRCHGSYRVFEWSGRREDADENKP